MSDILLTDAPAVALLPLTKSEAEAIAAMDAVLKRYNFGEWLRCRVCFAANRMDGARSVVTSRTVRLECRCGIREFTAPQGTTDLAPGLSNVPDVTEESDITVIDGNGKPVILRAKKLPVDVALIIRTYSRVMGELQYNPKLVDRRCWDKHPYDSSAMEVLVDPSKIALRCNCSVWHFTGSSAVN